jgi:hypothetical protein
MELIQLLGNPIVAGIYAFGVIIGVACYIIAIKLSSKDKLNKSKYKTKKISNNGHIQWINVPL